MADAASKGSARRQPPLVLVTGMSGAGKSTALNCLEDHGYDVVDNLPLKLLTRLLATSEPDGPRSDRPLAVGIDARTRNFDAEKLVRRIKQLREDGVDARLLFIDCAGGELVKRFSETRRRHPLAQDRPATDGIAREREIMAPLRRWADIVIDTTDFSVHELTRTVVDKFARGQGGDDMTLSLISFGFARGVPRDADMMFDMRFLANPHWQDDLRPLTGKDPAVGAFIEKDEAFDRTFQRIAELVHMLVPAYAREGKAYLTVAIGCTGGRHRSVFVTEKLANYLRERGLAPTIVHRDVSGHSEGAEAEAAAN